MFHNLRAAIALVLFTVCVAAQSQEITWAVMSGDIRDVESLLASGANVNETDSHGWTPLMHAAFYGLHDIAIILINGGASIDVANAKTEDVVKGNSIIIGGVTALMIAAIRENADIVICCWKKVRISI